MTTWTTTWIAAALVALGGCSPATRATPVGNATGAVGGAAHSPLVGSWHLVWLELPGPDGALRERY